MLQTNSIAIFKELIVEELPDYSLLSDSQILEDFKWFLGIQNSESKSSVEINIYINNLGEDKVDITEYLLGEIAQQFILSKQEDEIIRFLLNNPTSNFEEIFKQINQITSGIHRLENTHNKTILQELEAKFESEDLEVVLQRIDRKERKKILEDLENEHSFDDYKYGTNDHLFFSDSNELNQPKSKESIFKNRFYFKVAASLILFAIPTFILLFMNEREQIIISKNKYNKKVVGQEYYASSMVEISLPKVNVYSSSKEVNRYFTSQGFGPTADQNIEIKLIELAPQLKYVLQKSKQVTFYKNQINKKSFKHKLTTLDSLNITIKQLDKLEKSIIDKDNIYEFKGNELIILFINGKDLQKLKVFNYNERDKETYYLFMNGKYYELIRGKGKLNVLTDDDRIETLEELRINTP